MPANYKNNYPKVSDQWLHEVLYFEIANLFSRKPL